MPAFTRSLRRRPSRCRPGRLRDRWVRPYFRRYRKQLAFACGLAAAAYACAVALMSLGGYLLSRSGDAGTTLFSLMVPVACIQLVGLAKPLARYAERLASHDWVLRMASDLRRRLFGLAAARGSSWRKARREGDFVGLLSEDIAHVQDLYLRSVLPFVCALALSVALLLFCGAFSPWIALAMLLLLAVAVALLPLAAWLVQRARVERVKAGRAELYARLADDVSGAADWAISGRAGECLASYGVGVARADAAGAADAGDGGAADTAGGTGPGRGAAAAGDGGAGRGVGAFAATDGAGRAHGDAAGAKRLYGEDVLARERRRLDRAARLRALLQSLLYALFFIVVFLWAADAFDLRSAPASNWAAAFALGFFPLLDLLSPLPEAALSGAENAVAASRLNALDADVPADAPGEGSAAATMPGEGGAGAGKPGEEGSGTGKPDEGGVPATAVGEGEHGAYMPSAGTAPAGMSGEDVPAGFTGRFDIDVCGLVFSYGSAEPRMPGSPDAFSAGAGAAPRTPDTPAAPLAFDAVAPRVLDGMDLHIPHGQRVAMLGRSGSGKSTLLSCMRGVLAPSAGSVRIAGVETTRLARVMPQLASVVEQDSRVFNRSVRDNLLLAAPDAGEYELWEALAAAGLAQTVRAMPQGLDTVVAEDGARLSGGQRQRLVLARALLDEPFAALDPATERAVFETLLSAARGKTLVVVTHHLQGVECFDRVVFLEDGRIAADGAPAELAARDERFARLLAFEHGGLF